MIPIRKDLKPVSLSLKQRLLEMHRLMEEAIIVSLCVSKGKITFHTVYPKRIHPDYKDLEEEDEEPDNQAIDKLKVARAKQLLPKSYIG